MKDEIEATLAELVGMALIETHRAADMEMFTFGRSHHRDLALHVQCPWRIEHSGAVVVGYRDMRDPPTGMPVEGFDPNEAKLTRRDELLQAFMSETNGRLRHVVGISATDAGDLRLGFDEGSALSIFPDSGAADDEYWRLLRLAPGGDHYVVGGHGFVHMPGKPVVAPP
jgi:hypothetical protein